MKEDRIEEIETWLKDWEKHNLPLTFPGLVERDFTVMRRIIRELMEELNCCPTCGRKTDYQTGYEVKCMDPVHGSER